MNIIINNVIKSIPVDPYSNWFMKQIDSIEQHTWTTANIVNWTTPASKQSCVCVCVHHMLTIISERHSILNYYYSLFMTCFLIQCTTRFAYMLQFVLKYIMTD